MREIYSGSQSEFLNYAGSSSQTSLHSTRLTPSIRSATLLLLFTRFTRDLDESYDNYTEDCFLKLFLPLSLCRDLNNFPQFLPCVHRRMALFCCLACHFCHCSVFKVQRPRKLRFAPPALRRVYAPFRCSSFSTRLRS